MADCCTSTPDFTGLSPAYRRALWAVILINAVMFGVEMTAGFAAQSQALKADALDFLADTLTYGASLAVIGWPLGWRSRVALIKGWSLAAMGLWVLGYTLYQVFVLGTPHALTMGTIGFLALAANVASVLLLLRYREGDANVRSVWLCSRNDAIGNVAVLMAAAGVGVSGTAWPDLLVAALMASLFLNSSIQIIRQATRERAADIAQGEAAQHS